MNIQDLIIEMMPFSDGIKNFCRKNQDFANALKIVWVDKFIALQAIVTTRPPSHPEDEVIGMYVYDYRRKNPIFKQDFIINIGKMDREFVLYTGLASIANGKSIRPIREFYLKYGADGSYENTHHQTINELPKEFQERGQLAINLAEKRKRAGYPKITDDHVKSIYEQWKMIHSPTSN